MSMATGLVLTQPETVQKRVPESKDGRIRFGTQAVVDREGMEVDRG